MFSIIIPLFNKEKYIYKTLLSVINQSFPYFEVIVVNDGSTDNSLKIVQEFKDKRIRVFSIQNGGVSRARNFGISKSKFEYISFLDADDLWEINYLETIKDLINNYPEADVFATNYKVLSENKTNNYKKYKTGLIDNYFKSSIKQSILHTSSTVVSINALKNIGIIFNENLSRGEDLDLWMRLSKKYKIAFNKNACSSYNLNTNINSKSTKHHPIKSIAYHIDNNLKNMDSTYEIIFINKIIIRKMIYYLIKERNFAFFWMILKKQYL